MHHSIGNMSARGYYIIDMYLLLGVTTDRCGFELLHKRFQIRNICYWVISSVLDVVEKFTRQAQVSIIHQLRGNRVNVLLEDGFELAVQAFDEAISDWMVCSSADTLGSQELHQLGPKGQLKLVSTITCDGETPNLEIHLLTKARATVSAVISVI